MHKIGGFVLGAAALALTSGLAHADAMSLYVQGHGGYSGANLKEITPGDDSSLGATLGAEAGVSLLAFNGYLGYDDYLSRGTVIRAIVGFGGGADLAGWQLSARVGAGLMIENDGVFGDMAQPSKRMGAVGRVGLAFDRKLSAGLYAGIGIDAEYFALKPTDDKLVDTGVHTGADILGSLHLGFEIGL